ncbi:Htur_1727 family rSAM-partnered candidate RiPP [Halopiger goleimassiliensis]|uniref:Htur_1727 family rSAM-partnered candidate RiPP n=1 Tax=Halopiger goleimassiliensis TaxID=1293048 RepID=UPI000677AF3B|nr:Htur_1727 family rSAM-partnered candidate RiPP [Halopiger goleimassiliensis]
MVEKTRRRRVESDGDDRDAARWEVFCRDDPTDPLRHVGSVVADDAEEAHEHAARLFGWYAVDVWVCPATSVARFSTRASESERGGGDEPEGDGEDGESEAAEPRVYEETEGTPHVRDS